MNPKVTARQVQEAIMEAMEELGLSTCTYREAGVLTRNLGVVAGNAHIMICSTDYSDPEQVIA